MSKAYPSNLTFAQYEILSDVIPEAKPGGRKREVDMWAVLNGIFYILVEGVRWRALPEDFPPWQTAYTYFRNWRKDGTWVKMQDFHLSCHSAKYFKAFFVVSGINFIATSLKICEYDFIDLKQ